MLRREGLRSLSQYFRFVRSERAMMALDRHAFAASSCGFSLLSEASERRRFRRKVLVDLGIGSRVSSNKIPSLRGCLDRGDGIFRRSDDGTGKARAVAPYGQSVPYSENFLKEELGAKLVNEKGSSKHGNPLAFSDHYRPEKLVVAVDVDEVLGSFLSALNKFIADRYSMNHSLSEYHVYEFFKIWNCSQSEAAVLVHEFFKTAYFEKGIHPIPGARRALHSLSTFCNLLVVTSRQNAIKDHTLQWIEMHYPGLFKEIHFGNHFALDGQSRQKSEICRSLGAQVLIDDNPGYAVECAEEGIRVLLFDYDNSYPWSKSGTAASHPLVTKVHNWEEVEQNLVSLVASKSCF